MSAALSFTDHFNGRAAVLSLPLAAHETPRLPMQQDEIVYPIQLIKAASFFHAPQAPGKKRAASDSGPYLDYMSFALPPPTRVCAIFGCVAAACRRMAAAPEGAHVTTRRSKLWAECVADRVTRGLVFRVQVSWGRAQAASWTHHAHCVPDALHSERLRVYRFELFKLAHSREASQLISRRHYYCEL